MNGIDSRRIRVLNDRPAADGAYVLYWMQQSQRAYANPALEYAIRVANELRQTCVVAFGLMPDYPEATRRHFRFMLEGLARTASALRDREIKLVARIGEPWQVAREVAARASLVVCDVGYLRHQREWRQKLAASLDRKVVAVESDVVVPVECASDRLEVAARTLRPRIEEKAQEFLKPLAATTVAKSSLRLSIRADVDLRRGTALLDELELPAEPGYAARFHGGTGEARKHLTSFIRSDLDGYAERRNDPAHPRVSQLSPYLHFGQISPVEVALKIVRAEAGSSEDKAAYLDELIVRRELAVNYVWYCEDYDSYRGLPDWARETLGLHRDDERPHRYTRAELESCDTHDPYWNAAMREGVSTGYMHNYMRMYWGKKIIEWTGTPEYAFDTALYLNNRYLLDGRDASSYANVSWLFGLHDHGWPEREVFGTVRYMNAAGLERKFDMDAYVSRVRGAGPLQ